jgi:hypothetical protein
MPFIFGQPFTDLGSLLVTLFWILMLLDAATNKSIRGSRVLWMLFVFFTHIFGAIIYFCVGNPYLPNKLYKAVRQWYHQQQQAKPIQPAPKLYRDPQQKYQEYQEGYQAYQGQTYEPPSPVQGYEQQEYPQYEQPQAAYPEMPPQQQ